MLICIIISAALCFAHYSALLAPSHGTSNLTKFAMLFLLCLASDSAIVHLRKQRGSDCLEVSLGCHDKVQHQYETTVMVVTMLLALQTT